MCDGMHDEMCDAEKCGTCTAKHDDLGEAVNDALRDASAMRRYAAMCM